MISLLVLATFLTAPAGASATPTLSWQPSVTGTDARLRGLSAVSRQVAWASGARGTVLRTVDGGRNWLQVGPPDTATLDSIAPNSSVPGSFSSTGTANCAISPGNAGTRPLSTMVERDRANCWSVSRRARTAAGLESALCRSLR